MNRRERDILKGAPDFNANERIECLLAVFCAKDCEAADDYTVTSEL